MTGLSLSARQSWTVAAITVGAVLAAAGLTALVVSGADPLALAVLAVAAVAGLVVVLARALSRATLSARRLAADTLVMADANPAGRLDPKTAGDLAGLADAVNRLADRRETAEREVADQVEVARRDMEAERNRLAALMEQLTVAVIVCNVEGRILLYNPAARSLVGDDAPLGLGRSVFGIVDRGLIAHAYDRLASGSEPVQTATTLRGEQLFRVRVALVREQDSGASSGFVLVLEDLTRQVRASDQRERLLRRLTESTRGSLGSMRAAVESVLDFPDLTSAERASFLEIVREEADTLGRRVEEWAGEAAYLGDDRVLTDIAGGDLLDVLQRELARVGVVATTSPSEDDLWVRADSHAVAQAVAHLATRLRDRDGVVELSLAVAGVGRHGQVDASWSGSAPSASVVEGWLDEPLSEGGSATVRDVAERHGAEVWCGNGAGGSAYLRVLLPRAADDGRPTVVGPRPETSSRPEFYDFDLFTPRPQSQGWDDRRLEDLSFTVFDTETTGLDPVGGDRIVSIGAVRVVNGRVLRQETFEQLVQPHRSVPQASTAIHGITSEMLQGQPTITEVLPLFSRFAEDTVLVGHNVSFDLQFVKLSDAPAGVGLSQPALDTLLLDAALHPDHEDHTLEAIAARLGVSVIGRHTALGDALLTADIFVGLLSLLRRRGIGTLGEAIEAARETYHARVNDTLYGA